MKKSYKKLLAFMIVLTFVLLLNSFIISILKNYYFTIALLFILLIVFKLLFGFEKDKSRYIKDIFVNITIIYLTAFIIYYLLGLVVGFVRTTNYYSVYGFTRLIIPYVLIIVLKEYLRYHILTKSGNNKMLIVLSCIMFIIFDITNDINSTIIESGYNAFMFLALTLLPAVSNNVVCTFICKKVGYNPNIYWLLVANLYGVLLPIVPDTGIYIGAMIKFLFPPVLAYNIYSFYERRSRNVPLSDEKKFDVGLPIVGVITIVLVYLVSGYFRFYAVAIATGSMTPAIYAGDIVIVDKKMDYKDLKVGEVIAYRYDNIIVVHRLVDILKVDDDYYFYTKGDANNDVDNYIIYPETIIGTVNFKIPYIGLPTVWLNKMHK